MTEIRHFLVVKRFGRLESVAVYDDASEAIRAYEQAERECGWITAVPGETPAAADCVLLGADRLSTCIATHGNWFDEPSQLEGLLDGPRGMVRDEPTIAFGENRQRADHWWSADQDLPPWQPRRLDVGPHDGSQ